MDQAETPIENKFYSVQESVWKHTVPYFQGLPLKEDLRADVVIVGGGIAGISIAYSLVTLGLKVVLVEKGDLGSGETVHSTAHLSTALDSRYYKIEKIFGKDFSRMTADSHRAAIDFIELVCKTENIDAEFLRVPGYLLLHSSDQPYNLHKEYEAAMDAGLPVKWLDLIPGIRHGHQEGIEFMHQAQFQPLKYITGLANAAAEKGAQIFTRTQADNIYTGGISTQQGFRVEARYVVIATNNPVNDRNMMHGKQFAYRTYVIGLRIPKDSLPQALWWDTGDQHAKSLLSPYHYVRTATYNNTYDLLLVGGEDHPTGLAFENREFGDDRYAALEARTRTHFPMAAEVIYRWFGQVMEPMDGLAFIGRNPGDKDNVFIVTGDAGNGLTHGTIAALLIPDLIMQKENRWASLYNPSRKKNSNHG
ncbi:Glycine/D-amino acid oxidase [Chitinophaga costaii]|uniref:Glycine/D-amino acid oxidase n=1 Tax=Chitinophaga costaii TaxID=1335309 RepID=A0A1C4AID3_9BACT|nr:FAD-dependent oxidoreductase [Chitinophaga costaii]PUZ26614.1 FAD-binding oxidoreductase [Chitinophaga costaii]SCB94297.1 Glycine/D-amino acid oxidase [Chitinophaga costaii]